LWEVQFLKQINEIKLLQDPDVLKIALYRYEKLWLPFLDRHCQSPDMDLEYLPPIDIHWIWHVHMLSPSAYHKDCFKASFSRMFNHKLDTLEEMSKKREKTKILWQQCYPKDPFDLPDENSFCSIYQHILEVQEVSAFGYDVIAAALRQRSFVYQV
jgi:hypothetical protein